jgi:hypothetical protein
MQPLGHYLGCSNSSARGVLVNLVDCNLPKVEQNAVAASQMQNAAHVSAFARLLFALRFDGRKLVTAAHGDRHAELHAWYFSHDFCIRQTRPCADFEVDLFLPCIHD